MTNKKNMGGCKLKLGQENYKNSRNRGDCDGEIINISSADKPIITQSCATPPRPRPRPRPIGGKSK